MSNPLNIGLFTGGFSEERVVALKSAQLVEKYLDTDKYNLYTIDVQRNGWMHEEENPFNLTEGILEIGGKSIKFDAAYVIIHGSPAEDGWIQGYFEMKNIPYTCSPPFASALTFDKQATKHYLKSFQVPMADSILLHNAEQAKESSVERLGLPLFVKPNKQGSSFGVSKVKSTDELEEAVTKAFQFDDEVLIESFIEGREFSCGVTYLDGQPIALPITEIKPFHEFFDYAGKYELQSEEITPAEISEELAEQCRSRSRQIYDLLQCKGMVRFDYILEDGLFKFLEANTIPGLSETSIIPQQVVAAGYTLEQFIEEQLLACL
jgi:D-alanine-D-alanine ligase